MASTSKMASDPGDLNKDMVSTKSPKRSFHALRIIVLCFSMICSFYICSICLQQTNQHFPQTVVVRSRFSEMPALPPPSETELDIVHFPRPKNYSREECVSTAVRFFAILSMQRSGSGWFETLLNSHINVSSNGEIFSKKERRSNVSSITATLNQIYNLDWFSSAAKNECTAAVGFKWMLNQGLIDHHKEIARYFNKRGVHVIFLFRRNLLRRHISMLANSQDRSLKLLNGTHKSHVHSREEAKILASYKPRINPVSLIPELETTRKSAMKALKRFNHTNHITLFYEDVVKNSTKLQDVLEFLKVPKMKLKSRQVKIHTKELSKQVKNWEDVYNTLKGSKYETFLDSHY